MAQNISVPDIGDFKDVEVIEVLVKPGAQINKNDPIVTIESDKSSVEIPSPAAGEIKDLKVKIGDKVSEGSILATIENGEATSISANKKKEEETVEKEPIKNGNLNPVKQVKKVFAEPASKDDIEKAKKDGGDKKVEELWKYLDYEDYDLMVEEAKNGNNDAFFIGAVYKFSFLLKPAL